MGIYGSGIGIGMPSAKLVICAVAVIAIIAAVALSALIVNEALQPKPLAAWFEGGNATLNIGEQTFLYVKVTNTTAAGLNNVLISAAPTDAGSLHVSPYPETSAQHDVIGSGESREARFLVNPLSEAVPGEYVIDISAESAAGAYSEQKIKVVLVE